MKTQNTRGNVLFIILIAVALFAALSYAVSNSFRGGATTITDEQARISAGRILRNMQDIRNGYQYLWTQQGCSIDEISFIKAGKELGTEDFDASSPRADETCDIFSPLGGGINYPNDLEKFQSNPPGQAGIYFFVTKGCINGGVLCGDSPYRVEDLGTTSEDEMIHFNFVEDKICNAVNRALGYNFTEIPVDGGAIIGDNTGEEFKGKTAGCRTQTGVYNQVFFVLQEL